MKKLLLALAVLFSFSTLSLAQPSGSPHSGPPDDHQERRAELPKKDDGHGGEKNARNDKKYPPKRYYYNESEGRYYSRIYMRNHRNVLCNDGVTVRAKNRNACKFHGGARYYW